MGIAKQCTSHLEFSVGHGKHRQMLCGHRAWTVLRITSIARPGATPSPDDQLPLAESPVPEWGPSRISNLDQQIRSYELMKLAQVGGLRASADLQKMLSPPPGAGDLVFFVFSCSEGLK